MITFEDFKKLDLRIAIVEGAKRIDGSDKLIKLTIDAGEGERQIIAGVGKYYSPEELVGRRIVIVANLEPRKLMGLESQGMLLAAESKEFGPVLLMPDKDIPAGSKIT
jgi:methionine--tRNA ligase beta chain